MNRPTQYVRSFRLTKFHGEILLRLDAGDELQVSPSGRVMLRSCEPKKRATEQLAPQTFMALVERGVIWRDLAREDAPGVEVYTLTETGQQVAGHLKRGAVATSALISRPRKSKLKSGRVIRTL